MFIHDQLGKIRVWGKGMNKIKSLLDKKYYDLSMELSYTQTYIFLNVFIPFLFIHISNNFESNRDFFLNLKFHLLLLISTSLMSMCQDKDSNSAHTNKYPNRDNAIQHLAISQQK